jgi:flagellar basal-body rod modification protein FlgD
MKNQDPLNPMDNAQVTSQMAQLSTVTGIDKLNATLQALSDSMTGNQSLQAASMIGHGVLVDGKGIELSGGAGFGGFELEQPAESVRVSIYNSAGVLLRDIEMGATPDGIVKWAWDGKDRAGANVSDGIYTFAVNATQAGKSIAATTLQFGMVNSVTQGKQGISLSAGHLDGIALAQVRQIL